VAASDVVIGAVKRETQTDARKQTATLRLNRILLRINPERFAGCVVQFNPRPKLASYSSTNPGFRSA
jgi:hypothetical protein